MDKTDFVLVVAAHQTGGQVFYCGWSPFIATLFIMIYFKRAIYTPPRRHTPTYLIFTMLLASVPACESDVDVGPALEQPEDKLEADSSRSNRNLASAPAYEGHLGRVLQKPEDKLEAGPSHMAKPESRTASRNDVRNDDEEDPDGDPPSDPEEDSTELEALPHELESEVFTECVNGVCSESARPVRSNRTSKEVKAIATSYAATRAAAFAQAQLDDLPFMKIETQRAVDVAHEKLTENPEERIEIVVHLQEKGFDFSRLRGARRQKDARRLSAIMEERMNQLAPSQSQMERLVSSFGGEAMGRRKLINAIDARVPPQALIDLAEQPQVLGISLNGKNRPTRSTGLDRRRALGLPDGGIAEIDGGQGAHRNSGPEVRFGVIETDNSINNGHVGFLDWAGGPNRIIDTDRCTYWFPSRRCINSATTSSPSHGTTVTSILAGSIEQGQDSSITSTFSRRHRSGIATEAEIHYYSTDTRADTAVAIEEATGDDGIDIINMSLGPKLEDEPHCHNGSWSGVRGAIRAAENAGVLVVTTAGNDDNRVNKACTVNSYGAFPDTLTIGGLDETSDLASLDSVDLANYSGRGSVAITLEGGRSVYSRMVDLVVTGSVDYYFASGSNGYNTIGDFGTSYAAPQVAGVAGLLLDWAEDRGGIGSSGTGQEDPYILRVLLSVMGDGATGVSGGGSGLTTLSKNRGFGNLRFVDLDEDLGSGGAWGVQKRFVTEGDVVEWSVGSSGPESSSVRGWKFAALWDENLYGGSADIKFQLIDKCPAGGGISVVRTASRYPLKARMRVRESEIGSKFAGKCLWVRATVEHADGTIPLYTADYFYTNGREHHAMD